MNLVKNIRETAKNVLLNEAKAIEQMSHLIDQEFESTVSAILECKGRVVVSGIGKSAIVASKITATLNSTGTPSMYMHAADAIHGDLGMLRKEDIVLLLSKSGNTPEIKVLIPLIRRAGCKLIGMVSSTDSDLGRQADYVLNATIEEEACPLNLAPTTSTTVHMALGDALAVCLLESRGFTSEDFAKFHPGGSLGKQLYLKVSDIYPNNQCPVVLIDASIEEIILEMTTKRLGATAVVDEKQKLKGIITDGDLRRMLNTKNAPGKVTAESIMSANPRTVDKECFATQALAIMQQNNITQVIVAEKDNILGFVHLHDLLKEGII
ncbi:MAG: D-arabinose 5-phosphate isomerase [Cyclobacteriaceae bacterium]|nr:MAG: D-arabinose 5-phosphate isomerase [Cyclobacteriaceae bacterium]